MAGVLRAVGAIVAGVLVVFVLLIAVEMFSAVVHPFPPDFGGTPEEISRHVERYPGWILAVVVPAWAVTAFAGTWVAGRLGNWGCALLLGLVTLAALVCNLSMLPYPLWFKIACLVAIPGAIATGIYLSRRRNFMVAHVEV